MNKISLSLAQIGFIKAIGVVVLTSVLSFLGEEANLTGVFNPIVATLITALAASFESHLKEKGNGALFGAVAVK